MAIRHSSDKSNNKLSLDDILKSANSLGLLAKVKAKQLHNPNSQLFDKLLNVFFKQRTYTHMYKKISTKHIINKLKTTNYKCKYRLGK